MNHLIYHHLVYHHHLSILTLMEKLNLPGDINGLTKKLHLFAAWFFAGNTTAKNELIHVLDTLHRL